MIKKAIIAAAALITSTPAVAQPEVIYANMSTRCGRAADFQDAKTIQNVNRLVHKAFGRGAEVEVRVIGGGQTIGVYPGAMPRQIPVTWKTC